MAVIFEVKRVDNEERLEKLAEEALEQIKEREYYAKMKQKGYEVISFGIAFCGAPDTRIFTIFCSSYGIT